MAQVARRNEAPQMAKAKDVHGSKSPLTRDHARSGRVLAAGIAPENSGESTEFSFRRTNIISLFERFILSRG